MRFFLSFFIASVLFSTVSFAQSRNVLADGNPPLTQAMVDRLAGLFEWSLDTEFSAEERSRLRNVVTSYWKNGDEKSIRSVLDTLAFEEKLAGASEDQRQNLQPQVKQELLSALEKDAAEPMNKLLLAIYNGRNALKNDPNFAAQTAGGSLENFIGRWQVSHMNSLSTQNVYSGAIGDANGMVAEYDIRADGRVIFSFFLSQNNYGCTTKIKTSKTGRVSVSGKRITFAYETGTTTSTDSCNAKYNYTKSLGRTSETFSYELKRENGKAQFCFANDQLKDCAVRLN